MPFITLEEHYISPHVSAASQPAREHYALFPPPTITKLECLDTPRIHDMDAGQVSLQVISHGPGDVPPQVCRQANDDLASAVARHPRRLAAFAMLPMTEPDAAAEELTRCVTEHGFLGALVENHLHDGTFYDDQRFWPVFAIAEQLDVPIYIHPAFASEAMLQTHHRGNYDDSVALALSAFGWSWHTETGLHVLRLYASGLFDRFPRLKILLGHMGEMLPFQLDRVCAVSERWPGLRRKLRDVWRHNIYVTTSGMFSLPPLACLLQTTSIDHVLYSVDYPFSSNERGLQFFEEVKKSGLIAGEDLDRFAYKNAETLLGVKLDL
ncbi:hypothetical protein ASPZODRAFT_128845 [Penicilliopsis zonata CBS 506.65]|uniref:Amidohydrolase-related domain-containing protein n=1 Tax=Penicilliopsis zonata CBS 506.65 TaxID=1073090 RepID=A0A1L9SSQ9_9EURO|nr:hypothetical protein ASPZODRAFT_128845 [Penicilliopsis zonata CBS 506.65]OJJ50219.1 hypothetical protein ASPZODRAFT_128845 [Penicilliopsis zonata CBS 506.65]